MVKEWKKSIDLAADGSIYIIDKNQYIFVITLQSQNILRQLHLSIYFAHLI